jgi:hypothetical protein
MTIHRSALRGLALSTLLIAIPLGHASAQDAKALAERFQAAMAAQNMTVTWTNVTGDPARMVLEGVTFMPVGAAEGLPIGNVTLENVSDSPEGLSIGKASTDAFSKTQDGTTVDISPLVVTGLVLPPQGGDALKSITMYDAIDLDSLSVKMGDKQTFGMNQFHIEVTPPTDGKPLEFSGSAEKFTADLSGVQDPQSKAVIDAMGYQTINGFFELAGSWQPTDGRMALSQYDISVENAGTLGISFDVGGYTPAFIASMQELQKKMAAQPAGSDNSAQGLAMLGLMQQLTFHQAAIRYDDDSLTGKILDLVAKQQGVTPADIKNQAKAILPFALTQLNNAELTAQVSAAVNKFLDEPKSLEITAAPAQPVPFAMIAAGAMSAPLDLPKTLGLTVTANEGGSEEGEGEDGADEGADTAQ